MVTQTVVRASLPQPCAWHCGQSYSISALCLALWSELFYLSPVPGTVVRATLPQPCAWHCGQSYSISALCLALWSELFYLSPMSCTVVRAILPQTCVLYCNVCSACHPFTATVCTCMCCNTQINLALSCVCGTLHSTYVSGKRASLERRPAERPTRAEEEMEDDQSKSSMFTYVGRKPFRYCMGLNFRGTKLSWFSQFNSHPRKFSSAKI